MLVCFPGGSQGARYHGKVHGVAPPDTVREYLAALEPVLPGAQHAFNGRAYQDFWIGSPFTRGAYSYYKLGQYTTLAGVESRPEGDVHFCGEQTSYNWQGYINGAVQSGERAAREVLASRLHLTARSSNAQSKFTKAICSAVWQRMSSSRGLHTSTLTARAREMATLNRLRSKRKPILRGRSSPLEVAIE